MAVARGTQRNVEGWVARKRPDSKSAKAAAAAQSAAQASLQSAVQPESRDEPGMDDTGS
jgi:bifunctional UDP-N-acetylglucosamine pyrophosphorylase/glucosamine-1-phosphate N-acetyltransferase